MSRTFVLGIGLFAVLFATGEGLKGAMEQILEANMNPGGSTKHLLRDVG